MSSDSDPSVEQELLAFKKKLVSTTEEMLTILKRTDDQAFTPEDKDLLDKKFEQAIKIKTEMNKVYSTMIAIKLSKERCEKCNAVAVCKYSSVTEMYCEDMRFTDKLGNKHVHNPNKRTDEYFCSRQSCKNRFERSSDLPCPIKNCTWNQNIKV